MRRLLSKYKLYFLYQFPTFKVFVQLETVSLLTLLKQSFWLNNFCFLISNYKVRVKLVCLYQDVCFSDHEGVGCSYHQL